MQIVSLGFNLNFFLKKAKKLATQNATVVEKPPKTCRRTNVNCYYEMDLDIDDLFGDGLKDKNDATKMMASMRISDDASKHGNESNKKKSSSTATTSSKVPIVAKSPKSVQPTPSTSSVSSSPPSPKMQQKQQKQQEEKQQTSSPFLKKRQRTRSTGVRHKVSDIIMTKDQRSSY